MSPAHARLTCKKNSRLSGCGQRVPAVNEGWAPILWPAGRGRQPPAAHSIPACSLLQAQTARGTHPAALLLLTSAMQRRQTHQRRLAAMDIPAEIWGAVAERLERRDR